VDISYFERCIVEDEQISSVITKFIVIIYTEDTSRSAMDLSET
jgi:hypothetical protein